MNDLKTAETCDKCGKTIEILIADFEDAMKDDHPILCPDCQATLNEQAENDLPYMVFKYKAISIELADFDGLGLEGWALIAVDNGIAYFKREYLREAK